MPAPLTFIVSRSYAISTPESREAGDIAESGFEFEKEAYDLEDLNRLIRHEGFVYPSSEPMTGARDWLSGSAREDRAYFERGVERIDSLHLVDILDVSGKSIDEALKDRVWKAVHQTTSRHCALEVDELEGLAI